MGSIKDRNGMDLTEAEAIKKRWQEYTEELYKKDLHDPDNHDASRDQVQAKGIFSSHFSSVWSQTLYKLHFLYSSGITRLK